MVGQIYCSELDHRQDLEVDLVFCYGKDWRKQIFYSPAAQVYINRLSQVSKTKSALLVSHSYIRDVVDLLGEQSLRNITLFSFIINFSLRNSIL